MSDRIRYRPGRAGGLPLFWRVVFTNATILIAAWFFLAFSPAAVRSPLVAPLEGLAGVAALSATVVINLVLMRRFFAPLERLRGLMRRVDPLRPGLRLPEQATGSVEVAELTQAFNEMLDRLERERRETARHALAAQEGERLRLARELHDEIGQRLTALVLQLEYAVKSAPPELARDLAAAREEARESLDDLRRVAARLRPEALDDLGLRSALTALCERICSHASFRCERQLDTDLPPLSPEAELVIYRVAQEALTNAARHASATRVTVSLARHEGGVVMRVEDDGTGLRGASEGAGITGMRERALLVGANLEIAGSEAGGVAVTLAVPAGG